MSASGVISEVQARIAEVRIAPSNGHGQVNLSGPKSANMRHCPAMKKRQTETVPDISHGTQRSIDRAGLHRGPRRSAAHDPRRDAYCFRQ
jgi:hypothetical protein